MSYIQCPDCSKNQVIWRRIYWKFLDDLDLELLGELPMTKEIIDITHNGVTEISDDLDSILTNVVEKLNK